MLIKNAPDIRSSEITDKKLYLNRREFIRATSGTAAAVAAGVGVFGAASTVLEAAQPAPHGRKFENVTKSPLSTTDEKLNTWDQITTYNNFYEFGTDKESPSIYAKSLKTEPWKVVMEGECSQARRLPARGPAQGPGARRAHLSPSLRRGVVDGDTVGRVPAVGADQEGGADGEGEVRRVLHTLYDPSQMVGVRQPVLRWPYIGRAPDGRGDASADDRWPSVSTAR